MNLYMALYLVFLFVVLTPGVLLRIPPKGSKLVVAAVHGIVFAVVLCLTYNLVSNASYVEHFQNVRDPKNCELYGNYAKDSYKKFEDEKDPKRKQENERNFYKIRDEMMNYCQPVKPPPRPQNRPPPSSLPQVRPGGPPAHCQKYIGNLNRLYSLKDNANRDYDNHVGLMKKDGCDPTLRP